MWRGETTAPVPREKRAALRLASRQDLLMSLLDYRLATVANGRRLRVDFSKATGVPTSAMRSGPHNVTLAAAII